MEKHFKLTEEFIINAWGVKLFRIKSTVKSKYAEKDVLGGFVEKEENVFGNAWVSGNAQVFGNAQVSGNAQVYGDARVYGNAWVYGDAQVYGNAEVSGNAQVYGDARVYGNAEVSGNADICVFQGFGSASRTTTFFKTEKGIFVACGCFEGDLAAFVDAVKKTHGEGEYAKQYLAIVEVVKIKFNL